MIAEMRAEKESVTVIKDQELNAAQAEISQRLQEAEKHSSKLQEAAVFSCCQSFSFTACTNLGESVCAKISAAAWRLV